MLFSYPEMQSSLPWPSAIIIPSDWYFEEFLLEGRNSVLLVKELTESN